MNKNTFRAILSPDIERYKLRTKDGQIQASGIFSANDGLITINIGELNKNITTIHELAHWMYTEYAVLRNNPELQTIIQDYIDLFKGKIIDEKYYLGETDVFSRFIEFMVAEEKGGIYKTELESKRKLLKISNNGVDLLDPKILKEYTEKVSPILKRYRLKK